MIDIVVTSYFRPDFTYDCLSSIQAFTTTPHRVIVVDNGSDKETIKTLRECQEEEMIDELILLPNNLGLEPAKNIGLQIVESDFYVDSDNDILLPPPIKDVDWLARLMELMTSEYAAIALPPQVFIGANKEEMFRGAKGILERDFVGGSMRLMRTDAVRAVGGWRSEPKDMVEANRSEEHYICGKLRKSGYKVGYAVDIECFHMFGETAWGYQESVEHYHRPQWPIPSDRVYGTPADFYKKFDYKYE